jgi:hypothetical protein
MFSLRQVISEETKNISVGNFKACQDNVYKLSATSEICPGTFCVYRYNSRTAKDNQEDYVAIYSSSQSQGCKLLAYTLKRQRIYPIFRLEQDGAGLDFYLVFGETLLDCQKSVEDFTGLKVVEA